MNLSQLILDILKIGLRTSFNLPSNFHAMSTGTNWSQTSYYTWFMSIWLIHEKPFYRQWSFQVKSAQDFVSINSMQESHCRCTSSFGIIFISWLIASFRRNPTNPLPFLEQKHLEICSLKLTTRTWKIDAWKTIHSFLHLFKCPTSRKPCLMWYGNRYSLIWINFSMHTVTIQACLLYDTSLSL